MVEPLSLLVLTGLSGAGKSQALKMLEDSGFYCVDNLPSSLLAGFVEQCKNANIRNAALAIDGRESAYGLDGTRIIERLQSLGMDYRLLFLDCTDEALRRRYTETRRRHPFARGGDLMEGISRERELLEPLREHAHLVIDTSALTPQTLFRRLDELLKLPPQREMAVLFTSFGYKRGLPIDADIVLDTRFLPNPFYVEALRPLSGLDAAVRDYLLCESSTLPFFDAVQTLCNTMLPGFAAQGKQRVMIAFGCTGGRHRSVLAADEMARRFANGPYRVRCAHRDLAEEASQIKERFE